jgi:thioester reductase-like protein
MQYVMLTGATGLLGRYLLRNLMLRGTSVAVLIRPTRIATARQRVESLLREIEDELQTALPRPMILSGDLNASGLKLSSDERTWAARNVRSILHNAASLSFESKGEGHEPWISNVGGTENILEFARQNNIRRFHHVSTAYVCGLRNGLCLETELDVGQSFGNDYERSKLRAESIVQNADWIDERTIYRPAIIVGDSKTAFSSTFHGFYTPLKIVSSVVNKLDLRQARPQSFVEVLGLAGHERKNLVPVDWVSETLVDLMLNPRAVGQTYHLAPRETVSVARLLEIMQKSIDKYSVDWSRLESPQSEVAHEWGDFLTMFVQQMETYRAYWRDDPTFDLTNTDALAGHLVCPTLDDATLMRLCEFAIQNKFWWSKGDRVEDSSPVRQWIDGLPTDPSEDSPQRSAECVSLQAVGPGGGHWTLRHDGENWWRCQEGGEPSTQATLAGTTSAFNHLLSAKESAETAVSSGRIVLLGPHASAMDLVKSLTGRSGANTYAR